MNPTSYAILVICLLVSTISLFETDAKVFTPCELAQELRRLQIPESQIATWVCIAHYESRLNSSAISQTGDHGIFQISEEYWCSPPGRGKGCSLTCAELQDDDISNDVDCVQTIFDEHQGLSGNGFNAWAVYPRCKKSSTANRFIRKCPSGSAHNSIDSEDLQLELRGGNLYLFPPPPRSSTIKSTYFQKPTPAPLFRPIQDFSKGYDYFSRSSPFSYTTKRPLIQVLSSSTVPPPAAVVGYSLSIYSPSRPSSYSIGSVYYNPLETKTTISPPVQYSLRPKTTYSTSGFDNRRTVFGFQSTPAPPVYKTYTRSEDAQVKTSSPAPTYKIKAPWADFPWWNGGK